MSNNQYPTGKSYQNQQKAQNARDRINRIELGNPKSNPQVHNAMTRIFTNISKGR